MFQGPLDRLSNAILQADKGSIPQSSLCLVNAEVSCHARIRVPLARKSRRLSNQPTDSLTQEPNNDTHVFGNDPDVFFAVGTPRRVPYQAAKVPKVHGGVICDEKGLAVNALVVQGNCGGGMGEQEGARGQQVGVGDVLDVSEIEEVVIVAQLPSCLARAVDIDQVVLCHDVALADDACGPDGGGQQLGVVGAVGFEYDLFGGSLDGGKGSNRC